MQRPGQLNVALSVDSFYAAFLKQLRGRGLIGLEVWTRLRKEGMYVKLRSRDSNIGWRSDYFRSWRELEGTVQLCSASRERL